MTHDGRARYGGNQPLRSNEKVATTSHGVVVGKDTKAMARCSSELVSMSIALARA